MVDKSTAVLLCAFGGALYLVDGIVVASILSVIGPATFNPTSLYYYMAGGTAAILALGILVLAGALWMSSDEKSRRRIATAMVIVFGTIANYIAALLLGNLSSLNYSNIPQNYNQFVGILSSFLNFGTLFALFLGYPLVVASAILALSHRDMKANEAENPAPVPS